MTALQSIVAPRSSAPGTEVEERRGPGPEEPLHERKTPAVGSDRDLPTDPDAKGNDTGASTVELLVWFPGLILIVVMILQVFQLVWARETAQSAARYGAYQARVYQGTDEDGRLQAQTYLDQVAGTLVQQPSITVTRTAADVTVTITARPRQVPLPALKLPAFTVHASGPIEQFTAGP